MNISTLVFNTELLKHSYVKHVFIHLIALDIIVYVQTDLFSGNDVSYQRWLPWRCVFPQFVLSRNSYNYSFLCPFTVTITQIKRKYSGYYSKKRHFGRQYFNLCFLIFISQKCRLGLSYDLKILKTINYCFQSQCQFKFPYALVKSFNIW